MARTGYDPVCAPRGIHRITAVPVGEKVTGLTLAVGIADASAVRAGLVEPGADGCLVEVSR
jgi:hypothetical protein